MKLLPRRGFHSKWKKEKKTYKSIHKYYRMPKLEIVTNLEAKRSKKGTSGLWVTQEEFIYTRNKWLTEWTAAVSTETMDWAQEAPEVTKHKTELAKKIAGVSFGHSVTGLRQLYDQITFFGISLQPYSTELFWKTCHWRNKHGPMPGESFKSSSAKRGLNACLNQKKHLKNHGLLSCLKALSAEALVFPDFTLWSLLCHQLSHLVALQLSTI